MTITALILVVISAVMHAGWNLFSKNHSPTLSFFQLATLGTIFWFSPVLLLTADLIAELDFTLWTLLFTAGLCQAIYYSGLARAYALGTLSISYPLARAFPLLFVACFTFAAGRGADLSAQALLGFAGIITGALILPMDSVRDFKLSNYCNSSSAFAMLAALGTAGYSFIDDIGMNLLKQIEHDAPGILRALLYLEIECIFTAVWLLLFMAMNRRSVIYFRSNWHSLIKPAFMTGLAIGMTYGIVLLAMTHAKNVSYVVALRQLSIPLGAISGIFLLKEKYSHLRFIGVGILFTGLLLSAIN